MTFSPKILDSDAHLLAIQSQLPPITSLEGVARSFPIPVQLDTSAIPEQGIDSADAFLNYLQTLQIVDQEGKLLIKTPSTLPPLLEEECQPLQQLLDRQITITHRTDGRSRAIPLCEWPDICSFAGSASLQTVAPEDLLLVGSQIWNTLPISYLVRCLEAIGVDPAITRSFVTFGLGEHQTAKDADIDTQVRFKHPLNEDQFRKIKEAYIHKLAEKCKFTAAEIKENCLDKLAFPGLLIIGAGGVDTTFSHQGKRLYVNSSSGLARPLLYPKLPPLGLHPYQTIIDFLCKLSRVPEPDRVNHLGYPRLLVDKTRSGYISVSRAEEQVVRRTFLQSTEPLEELKKIFKNHLVATPLSFICYLLHDWWTSDEKQIRHAFETFVNCKEFSFLKKKVTAKTQAEQLPCWIIHCLQNHVPFEEIKALLTWSSFLLLCSQEAASEDGTIEACLRRAGKLPELQLSLSASHNPIFLTFPLELEPTFITIQKLFSNKSANSAKEELLTKLLTILCPSTPLFSLSHKTKFERLISSEFLKKIKENRCALLDFPLKLTLNHLFAGQKNVEIGLLEIILPIKQTGNKPFGRWQWTTFLHILLNRFPSLAFCEETKTFEELAQNGMGHRQSLFSFASFLIKTRDERVCKELADQLLKNWKMHLVFEEADKLMADVLLCMLQNHIRGAWLFWSQVEEKFKWTSEKKALLLHQAFPPDLKTSVPTAEDTVFFSDFFQKIRPLLERQTYSSLSANSKQNLFITAIKLFSPLEKVSPLLSQEMIKQLSELPPNSSSSELMEQLASALDQRKLELTACLILSLCHTPLTEAERESFQRHFVQFLFLLDPTEHPALLLPFLKKFAESPGLQLFFPALLSLFFEKITPFFSKDHPSLICLLETLAKEHNAIFQGCFDSKSFCKLFLILPLHKIPNGWLDPMRENADRILSHFTSDQESGLLLDWLARLTTLELSTFPERFNREIFRVLSTSLHHSQFPDIVSRITPELNTEEHDQKLNLLIHWIGGKVSERQHKQAMRGMEQLHSPWIKSSEKCKESHGEALAAWSLICLDEKNETLSLQLIKLVRPFYQPDQHLFQECVKRLALQFPDKDLKTAISFFEDFAEEVASLTTAEFHPASTLLTKAALGEAEVLNLLSLYPSQSDRVFSKLLKRAERSKNPVFCESLANHFITQCAHSLSKDIWRLALKLSSFSVLKQLAERCNENTSCNQMIWISQELLDEINRRASKTTTDESLEEMIALCNLLSPFKDIPHISTLFFELNLIFFEKLLESNILRASSLLIDSVPDNDREKKRFSAAVRLFEKGCEIVKSLDDPRHLHLEAHIKFFFKSFKTELFLEWMFQLHFEAKKMVYAPVIFEIGIDHLKSRQELSESLVFLATGFLFNLSSATSCKTGIVALDFINTTILKKTLSAEGRTIIEANILVARMRKAEAHLLKAKQKKYPAIKKMLHSLVETLPTLAVEETSLKNIGFHLTLLANTMLITADKEIDNEQVLPIMNELTNTLFALDKAPIIQMVNTTPFPFPMVEIFFHFLQGPYVDALMSTLSELGHNPPLQREVIRLLYQILDSNEEFYIAFIRRFIFLFPNRHSQAHTYHRNCSHRLLGKEEMSDRLQEMPQRLFEICLYSEVPIPPQCIERLEAINAIPLCVQTFIQSHLTEYNFRHMANIFTPYFQNHNYWISHDADHLFVALVKFADLFISSSLIQENTPLLEAFIQPLLTENPVFTSPRNETIKIVAMYVIYSILKVCYGSFSDIKLPKQKRNQFFLEIATHLESTQHTVFAGYFDRYLEVLLILNPWIANSIHEDKAAAGILIPLMIRLIFKHSEGAAIDPKSTQVDSKSLALHVAYLFFHELKVKVGEKKVEAALKEYLQPFSDKIYRSIYNLINNNKKK